MTTKTMETPGEATPGETNLLKAEITKINPEWETAQIQIRDVENNMSVHTIRR